MPSPYEMLGLDPGASAAEVRRAYRRRAKETHPDQGGSVEAFRAVTAAREAILTGGVDVVDDGRSDGDADLTRCRVEYLDYEALEDHGWDVDDPDLFERAANAGLDAGDYGRFEAPMDEPLLRSAETCGFAWPYACRGGACANCAVLVVEGDIEMPDHHILPQSMLDRGIRLTCNGVPATPELRLVYNVKRMPELDDLRLPADRFERARADD